MRQASIPKLSKLGTAGRAELQGRAGDYLVSGSASCVAAAEWPAAGQPTVIRYAGGKPTEPLGSAARGYRAKSNK